MADSARRSSRVRRPASIRGGDFVGHNAVVRHEQQVERQAESRANRERLAAQHSRGQVRRETAAASRHDDSIRMNDAVCMHE